MVTKESPRKKTVPINPTISPTKIEKITHLHETTKRCKLWCILCFTTSFITFSPQYILFIMIALQNMFDKYGNSLLKKSKKYSKIALLLGENDDIIINHKR